MIQCTSAINEWVVKRSKKDAEADACPEFVYSDMYTGAMEAYAPFREVFPGTGILLNFVGTGYSEGEEVFPQISALPTATWENGVPATDFCDTPLGEG